MFRKAEIEQLRLRKDLLVVQSDVNRLLVSAEWEHLRSASFWRGEAMQSMGRYPILAAGLGIGAGILIIKMLRRPSAPIRWLGRFAFAKAFLSSIWKLFAGASRRR